MEINNHLVIWTVVLIAFSTNFYNGQLLIENKDKCFGPKELGFLREELNVLKKYVGDQEKRIESLESELYSVKQTLSARISTTTTDTITETMEPITIAGTETSVSETITSPTSSIVQISTSIGNSTTTTDTITETMEPITIAGTETSVSETITSPTSSSVQLSTSIGNKGKEFLILFMRNYQSASGSVTIYITTDNVTSVNISTSTKLNASIKSATDRIINVSSFSKETLPFNLSCNYLTIEPKAVLVQTSEPSTVSIFDSFYTGSTDGTLIIPTNKLSKKYFISSSNPPWVLQEYYSQFAIAVLYDRTGVNIRFKMRNNTSISLLGRTYRDQDAFSTILEKYETLQINHIADLSGTSVTSTEPIAVFSGNRCQELAVFGCSHMVTQLPPNTELDNQYIVPPFFDSGGTLVQIISGSKSFINVRVGSNMSSWQMSEQEYKNIEVTTSEVTIVDSDKPVLVTGIAMGSSNNGPYITIIPGVNQYVDHYKVVVPEGYTKNYVILIIQEKFMNYLQINGSSVHNYKTVHLTSTVLGATFSIRIIEVDKGPIVVSTTNRAKFGLIVYGHKYNDGYAFTGNYILS